MFQKGQGPSNYLLKLEVGWTLEKGTSSAIRQQGEAAPYGQEETVGQKRRPSPAGNHRAGFFPFPVRALSAAVEPAQELGKKRGASTFPPASWSWEPPEGQRQMEWSLFLFGGVGAECFLSLNKFTKTTIHHLPVCNSHSLSQGLSSPCRLKCEVPRR